MKEVKGITIRQVKSSNINFVGYDEDTSTLEVHFDKGGVYQYSPVTKADYKDMCASSSIGGYFYKNIRNDSNISNLKIK